MLENDANCAAWGEFRAGAGRGARSLACFTLGTGVGGGVIIDGELWTGANGAAGAFGHIAVDPNGPLCRCGQRGCVEQYASATAVATRYGRGSARDAFDAAARGEPTRSPPSTGRATGSPPASRTSFTSFSPTSSSWPAGWRPRATRCSIACAPASRDACARRGSRRVRIECSALGDDAGWIGAALWGARTAESASRQCGSYDFMSIVTGQFHWLDWVVLVLYIAGTSWLADRLTDRGQTIRDFFLGGRKLPWWAVSGSIVASEVSGVTFVALPAIAFARGGNYTYMMLAIGSILARVLIAYFLIPAYYRNEIYSPYEFMGRRLGAGRRARRVGDLPDRRRARPGRAAVPRRDRARRHHEHRRRAGDHSADAHRHRLDVDRRHHVRRLDGRRPVRDDRARRDSPRSSRWSPRCPAAWTGSSRRVAPPGSSSSSTSRSRRPPSSRSGAGCSASRS